MEETQMSTRINTNVTAFEAARNLSNNSDMLAKNIQRLSSGLRINSAADDAAGLVISTEFKAQISGLDQATRNSNDAINMVKTAEGALTEVHSLLISMRQLAVHASNAGVNSSTDVAADQLQIQSAIDSINRISSTTQFGNKKLLDGSATAATTTTAASATTTATSLSVGSAGTSTSNATYNQISVDATGKLLLHDTTGGATDLTSAAPTTSGGTATYTFSNGLSLTSASGALATGPVSGAVTTKASTSSTGMALEFQIGANGGQTASQSIQSMAADQLGGNAPSYKDANGVSQTVGTSSVSKIDVTTFKGAQDAIAVLDKAISDTSTIRAGLGAFQSNVLQSNVRSLGVSEQNLKASQSTITDTDLSAEIVDYTKNQILVQAGTSALGQANQAPQAILKLLQ